MSAVATPNACAAALFPVTARKWALTLAPGPRPAASHRLRARRVGKRLLRRERFRRRDEERRRRIERFERSCQVLRIDIGDERDVDAGRVGSESAAHPGRWRKRRTDEQRAEVRAADAQVDDRADGTAGRTDAKTAADLRREHLHPRLRGANLGDDVAAVDEERRVVGLPQRRVQRGAALRLVDLLAGEERRDPPRQADRCRVCDEQRQRIRTEAFLRQIDEPIVPGKRQPREALAGPPRTDRRACAAKARGSGWRGRRQVGIGRRIHRHRSEQTEKRRPSPARAHTRSIVDWGRAAKRVGSRAAAVRRL